MRVPNYYLGLIKEVGDPIWKQAVPDILELQDSVCVADPLEEENQSPVPNLVHRYPDRVLFLVSSECAMYCRFCTRKRKVGGEDMQVTGETISAGINYIAQHPEIRDVIVSGGDPLLLSDETSVQSSVVCVPFRMYRSSASVLGCLSYCRRALLRD